MRVCLCLFVCACDVANVFSGLRILYCFVVVDHDHDDDADADDNDDDVLSGCRCAQLQWVPFSTDAGNSNLFIVLLHSFLACVRI